MIANAADGIAILTRLVFTTEESADLAGVAARMGVTSLQDLLLEWSTLAREVEGYSAEDYAHALAARDALEILAKHCSAALQKKLEQVLARFDTELKSRTVDDGGAATTPFHRLAESDGWWWKRKPAPREDEVIMVR